MGILRFFKEASFIFSKRASRRERARWIKALANKVAHISVWADGFLSLLAYAVLIQKGDITVSNVFVDAVIHVEALQSLAANLIALITTIYFVLWIALLISEHYDRIASLRAA